MSTNFGNNFSEKNYGGGGGHYAMKRNKTSQNFKILYANFVLVQIL